MENLARVRDGKLDGQDPRCQVVMEELWQSFDAGSLYTLIAEQFPACTHEKLMWRIAKRITKMHCECEGYSDATIAALLEQLL